MKNISNLFLSSSALALGMAVAPVNAQNPTYAPGDLVLCFQKEGSNNTLYARIGNAAKNFRGKAAGVKDGVNKINILDINAELTSAFGPEWANDPTIYAGAAGVWGTSETNEITLQDGDPNRTLYITRARDGVGKVGSANSNSWDLTIAGDTAMSSACNGVLSQNNVLETLFTTSVAVCDAFQSQIDNQNPFLAPGIQGPAMSNTLEGGIQQVGSDTTFGKFGDAGNVEFALDLYRVLAINTAPGQVAGDVRMGSFEGTVTVSNSGKVSFIATAPVKSPEIVVQQPTGKGLTDNKNTRVFAPQRVGKASSAKTFTIKNTGKAKLTGIAITKNGRNKSNFIVSSPLKTTLYPGKSTTFTVKFKPNAKGTRDAAIHIKSNDKDENPFDIKLTGTGK